MRRRFAADLGVLMSEDENLVLITADLGYGMFDMIKVNLPDQFYNVGAAEQVAMDMAVGMTLAGKKVVVYSITPFLIYRTFESIRNYLDHEQVAVVMVGSGRGKDYEKEGFSHDASDHEILKLLKNVVFLTPENDFDLREIIYSGRPTYLNLKR